ncbi:MAG TPA: LysM peptidoglycan-binding domain-containing M23 family metallopeptidase [Caulobacteraceae bacterium]
MKRLLLAGLGAAALAGCATPQYPVTQGYTPPPPIKPKYPIAQPPAAPAPATQTPASQPQSDSAPQAARDSAAQTDIAPAGTTPTAAPAAVESTPLGPVATSPESKPTPTPAPPPAMAAPAPSAAVSSPAPEAYAPPQRVRRSEVRYVTDGKVVSAHGMYRDYEVQQGDHLDAIARDLNTSRDELIDANRLRRPYRLHPGEHIKVPVAKAYVVVSGDTLAGVAKRFGVGLGELSSLNDLPGHGRLTPGMFVALPARYDDRGPSRETFTQEVYTQPRPRATYETRAPTSPYAAGPYAPSAEALAAAAARREQASRPAGTGPSYQARPVETYAPRPYEAPVNAAALASSAHGKFIWPIKGPILSPFGTTGMGRRNDGVDISAPEGSEVRAAAVGQVVYAGDQVPGFGNLVLIKHSGGWVSAYAHLASLSVHMQEEVSQGEAIGTVGESGGVSQPQLHFELRYAATSADKAKPLDPQQILPK